MEKKRCNGCENQVGQISKLNVEGQKIDISVGFFRDIKDNLFCSDCWRK